MNKVLLIGAPGCGKSTLGRRVADALQLPFYDTDVMTRDRLKMEKPTDWFSMAFCGRLTEEQPKIMRELAGLDGPAVIATGAETALIPECAAIMQTMGTIIHIRRKMEIVLTDLKNNGKGKFVLLDENGNPTKMTMEEEAIRLYAKEHPHYEALANLTLENNGTADEGLEQLLNLLTGEK
jgi:shikimate kinase